MEDYRWNEDMGEELKIYINSRIEDYQITVNNT
jgi:hypothetical protein